MKFKVVVDSCCDFSEENKYSEYIEFVPLTLYIGEEEIIDDETFNQAEFIKKVAESEEVSKSACPAPGTYMDAYSGDYDAVFVVCLSGNLSGSYNSAEIGKEMYFDENPDSTKKIHVFDSCSASAGEGLIAEKICELALAGATFEEIVEKVDAFKLEMKTYFVLETLEPLRKNGRLTGLAAMLVSVLNIKPIMSATDEGIIIRLDQARGIEKALKKLIETVCRETKNQAEKVASVAYCNCRERALKVRDALLEAGNFKDVVIAPTKGVATLYACDGGIIISV